MKTIPIVLALMALVIHSGIASANTDEENRLALERKLQSQLKPHFLCKHIGLKDGNTLLSIELTEETWDNPHDTKKLVDKVNSTIKKHLPLSHGAVSFKVYVHEPTSGYGVAEVSIIESEVSLSYMYPDYQPWARGKIWYVRSQQSSNKKAATLTEVGDASVANAPKDNRLALERDVQSVLEDNYLCNQIGLKDNSTWLSIELKSKTWFNPVDTRTLVDKVVAATRRHLPLTPETTLFKVYIDDPATDYGIAEVSITQSAVSLSYIYPENAPYAQKEINNRRKRLAWAEKMKAGSNSSRNATPVSDYDAILSVRTTGGVLIAVDESAYSEFTRAATRNDYDLLTSLISAGRLVETSNNIKIKIVEYGVIKHKVKILEGKNAGSVGWIATEFVKKK